MWALLLATILLLVVGGAAHAEEGVTRVLLLGAAVPLSRIDVVGGVLASHSTKCHSGVSGTTVEVTGRRFALSLPQGSLLVGHSSSPSFLPIGAEVQSSLRTYHTDGSRGETVVEVVFSSLLIASVTERVTPDTWMEQLGSLRPEEGSLGSLTLADIAVPGTHDSGTFNLTTTSVVPPDAFAGLVQEVCRALNLLGIHINCDDAEELADAISRPWAVTETTGWTGQMERGGRSFDYRGYYQKDTDTWVIEHSMVGSLPNTTAKALAGEVRHYLDGHPGELILLEYRCYNGDCQDLADRFMDGLGPYGYHWVNGTVIPGNPTLAAMMAKNMRAILVHENDGQRDNVTVGIVNDYPDACNLTEILQYDEHAIGLFAGEAADAMRKIGYQVTADGNCVVRGYIGTVLQQPEICVDDFGFECSIRLLGYIDQLNSYFSLAYVLQAYQAVKPISTARYFGNLWNSDDMTEDFASVMIALNAINLYNRVQML